MEDIIQDAAKKGWMKRARESKRSKRRRKRSTSISSPLPAEAPVIKLANIIVMQAIKDRASDIHMNL